MSKYNSYKIQLCGGRGNIILFKIKFQRYIFIFKVCLQFLSEIKQYFRRKRLRKISFSCQINLTIGERPNKKDIESFNLTRKVNILRLSRGNIYLDNK